METSRPWTALYDPDPVSALDSCGEYAVMPGALARAPIDLAKDLVYRESMEVNVHEAKTHLSKLLQRVSLGEEVVIAKAGKPVAKLVPIGNRPGRRILGSAKGEFAVPDDFNDPLPKALEDLFWE